MSGGEEDEGKNWVANHLIHFQRKHCKDFSNPWGSPPLERSCLSGPCSLSTPGPEVGKPSPSSTHPTKVL